MTSPPYPPAAALAAFIREQASWRRTQAEKFPDDQLRNARSAIALDRLAGHVEDYAEGQSPYLSQLVELGALSEGGFVAGAEARGAVARWGFDRDTNLRTFRDLLQELVAITRRARQTAQKRNTPMSATMTRELESRVRTHQLNERERGVLEDLFTIARNYSRSCEDTFAAAHAAIEAKAWNATDLMGDYVNAIERVHAAIAVAAMARLAVLTPVDRGEGRILELLNGDHNAEAEALMRPIFEEAGIGDDFDCPDADLVVPATMTADAAAIGVALSGKRNPEHRAEMLDQLIGLANAGDQVAIEYLEANPELAFQNRGTWVVQVDSGPGSPGIAVGRDREGRARIVRTRQPGPRE